MSDSTPPRPKPGSLRDRIAAFEQKPAANPVPAPAPRPKPGGLSKWTPKPAEPPSPTSSAPVRSHEGGMSASDAKSSIGQGGSLKERMAALQGLGAFGGAPAPAEKPRPPTEKPKWKPPPQVQMSPPIGDDGEETAPKPFVPPVHAPGEQIAPQPAATGEDVQEEGVQPEAEGEEGEVDPEEEERQRRAAIAARMARLGGARVGMGPPVFGKKPTPPPKKPSMDESKLAEEKKAEDQPAEEAPSVQVSMDETPSTEAQPSASTDNLSLASNASSPPTSMPIPAAPKRAGPPRRKTATKSPSPGPQADESVPAPPIPTTETVLADEAIHKSPEPVDETVRSVSEAQFAKKEGGLSGDVQEEIGGIGESVDEIKNDAPEPTQERRVSSSSDLRPESPVTPPGVKPVAAPEPVSATPSVTRLPDPEPTAQFDEPAEAPVVEHDEPAPAAQEEEEEEEETHRKRVAERVAKMGGFNPFSGPPPPAPTSSEQEEIESPPMPQRKASMARVESTSAPQRQESVGSVYSPSIPERKDSASFAMPQHEELDEHARPPMPERKESLKVVPQRQGSVDVSSPTQLSVPEPPPLTRKDSSSSARSYTVTQIGGGRKVPDDEEGEEGPDLPDRSQAEDPAHGTDYMVSEMGHDSMTFPVQPDNDEGRNRDGGYVRREDSARVRHEDAGIDTGILQGGDGAEERVVLGGDGDDEAVEDGAHFVSDRLSPESAPIPVPTTEVTNDEPLAHADEDDEMAPPRPTRSLPAPPPPAPTPDMSTRLPASPPTSSPPPPAKRVSMPPVPRSVPVPASMNAAPEEMHSPHPPSKRTSFPPSSRAVPMSHATESPRAKAASQEQDDVTSSPGSHRTSMQPPARAVPSSHPTSPPRSSTKRTSIPPPSRAVHVPVPVEDKIMHEEPLAQEPEEIVDEPAMEEARPPPPPRKPSLPTSMHSPAMSASSGSPRSSRDIRRSLDSPRMFTLPPPPPVPVTIAPAEPEQEILDESDGDPIDPRFHSPSMSSQSRSPIPSSPPHQERELAPVTEPPKHAAPPAHTAAEEDEDKARRRTIADRMAKLGGIKFGAPPGAPPSFKRPQPQPQHAEDAPAGDGEASEAPAPAPVERAEEYQEEGEEEEHARRARIAAKLAGMGGMRFGMLPVQPAAHEPPHPAPKQKTEEHAPHPAPSHPIESDYEFEQQSASSDGVKVEEEESEMEEAHHADTEYQEEPEEVEAPPLPPSRPSTRPPIPLGKPPVPPPVRKGTIEAHPHPHPHTRQESYDTLTTPPPRPPMPPLPSSHSEYVMVDDEGENPPPLPSSRPPPRGPPPPRAATHPRAPPAAEDNSTGGQWEIPSVDFGDTGAASDLSASLWSEDSTAYPSTEAPAPPPHARSQSQSEKPRAPPTVPKEMSAEQLRAVWGRVGVQMCEAATTLHERSKRTLVGNGSYAGFVGAVLAQVPNASRPPAGSTEYGYLVYAQTGASVRARVDEILPGDVVVLEEARLKGHKGLHAYTLNVGDPGVPGVGVVTEFETKKVKIKALQANQHVGQATVESVSYKLEDLKSGTIKVYRVLEA